MKQQTRHTDAERDHFAFVAQLPCVVCGQGGVHVAHVRFADYVFGKEITGIGQKPHWIWTLPLRPDLHEKQHRVGEKVFWNDVGYPYLDPIHGPLALCLQIAGFAAAGNVQGAQRLIMQRVISLIAR